MGAGKTCLAAKIIFCLHKNDALAASCSIVSLRARQILQRFSVAEHAIPGAKPIGTYIDIIYFNPISFASFLRVEVRSTNAALEKPPKLVHQLRGTRTTARVFRVINNHI